MSLHESLVRAALDVLSHCPGVEEPVTQRLERDGYAVLIQAGPIHAMKISDDDLSDCERDILKVLRAAGKKLKGFEIRDALEASDLIHGESTITRALARLVHIKLLGNDYSKRGYYLP